MKQLAIMTTRDTQGLERREWSINIKLGSEPLVHLNGLPRDFKMLDFGNAASSF